MLQHSSMIVTSTLLQKKLKGVLEPPEHPLATPLDCGPLYTHTRMHTHVQHAHTLTHIHTERNKQIHTHSYLPKNFPRNIEEAIIPVYFPEGGCDRGRSEGGG